jgi:hypothetical protein
MTTLPPEIRRSARRLRYAALVLIALLELLLLFASWVLVSGRTGEFPALHIHVSGLPPWAGALTLLLAGILGGIALLRLVRMLVRVEAGEPFAAAGDLRGFAFYLMLAIAASVFVPAFFQLGIAAFSGGPHRVALDFGASDSLALLVSALLFFVARLLDEAQRLADDHSQIV